jgi:hypothetical protein
MDENGYEHFCKTLQTEQINKVQTSPNKTLNSDCRRFGPGVPGPTSEIAACPYPDGLARDGTQEVGQALYYPAPGVSLVVGVTSASREGEREIESGSPFVRSFPRTNHPPGWPWTSLL